MQQSAPLLCDKYRKNNDIPPISRVDDEYAFKVLHRL
jgi:hypothetical protein